MSLQSKTNYWEKKAGQNIYKKGMGFETTISSKHRYGFEERFRNENAKVLEEGRKEMQAIRDKHRRNYIFNPRRINYD